MAIPPSIKSAPMAGVIGDPISHSLSPALHRHWLNRLQLKGDYLAHHVPNTQLESFIKSLDRNHYRGFNVTVPHKQSIIPFCDVLSTQASAVGAVNMVTINADGSLHGDNSDVYGFSENLRQTQALHHLPLKTACVIGAGGAAYAVVTGLYELGFSRILICNRNPTRLDQLLTHMANHLDSNKTELIACEWPFNKDRLQDVDLLVNTTSLGMEGQPSLSLELNTLPRHAMVYDIVYRPLMTGLLQQAEACGLTIIDGLGMLIWQAAPAFARWLSPVNETPPIDEAVRNHLLNIIKNQS